MASVTDIKDTTSTQMVNVPEEQKENIVAVDFKMVTFTLAGKDYAIDIMKVKEIAKAGSFTYVPNTVPFVLGVYNLRGEIIPIIDLRRFFNIEVSERSKDTLENMLIVTVEEQLFGVVVDAIDKVIGIQKSSIQPPHPLFGDINIKYIYGVVESNDRLYVLLDVDRIFGVRTPSHQEKEVVLEEKPVESAVTETVTESTSVVKKSAEPVAEAEVSKGEEKVVPATEEPAQPEVAENNMDFNFIKDSLQKLKSFHVTAVNEFWAKRRFDEWIDIRGNENSQLVNEKDAEEYLSPFYSTDTSSFWSKEYAQNIYKILPDNAAKQITVWNPGSGKGYEAYSLACLMKKRYPEARVKIYAQDIDLLNISNAPLLSVPAELANSWYSQFLVKSVSGSYSFKPEIKDMIMFEYHDCMHANTMPMVDVIFSRDLLSFLNPNVQETLLEDFDEKLKGNGIIIVGENESLTHKSDWSEKMTGSVVVYTKQ